MEGICGKGVADWWGNCLCEGGMGVVGGGRICGWASRKKGGGRWGAGGGGGAELRVGGTWNAEASEAES